jgi:alpha-tubulin suppressor-like RCC1 family protein
MAKFFNSPFATTVGYLVLVFLLSTANHVTAAIPMVSSGASHSCAVLGNGAIQCWGSNSSGELGVGDTRDTSLVPATVSGIASAEKVSAGAFSSCAILNGGALTCWGSNTKGQLGIGTTTNASSPVFVTGIAPVSSVSLGYLYSCAVLMNGQIACWGINDRGQLGLGDKSDRNSPQVIPSINNAVQVTAGYSNTCALLSDSTVKCWGDGRFLPIGSTVDSIDATSPVIVGGLTGVTYISSGITAIHTCAVASSNEVRCWGNRGSPYYPLSAGEKVTQVSVNGNFNCGLLNTGRIMCTGENRYGQLGDGTYISSNSPVSVLGVENAVSVSAGATHICAQIDDGAIKCWGRNRYGQLGNSLQTPEEPALPGGTGLPLPDTRIAPSPSNVVGFGPDGKADQVFWWAERTNPSFFAPAGQTSVESLGFRFRGYSNGHYLGVNQTGTPHLFYLGPLSNNSLLDLNALTFWLNLAAFQ